MKLVVATRSAHKLGEIHRILTEAGLVSADGDGTAGGSGTVELLGLDAFDLPPDPSDDELEPHETFDENALAKARWYHALTGLPTVSDDSGLEVDALHGAPGVRSKRFAPDGGEGAARDLANNRHLMALLEGVPPAARTARYVCAVALVGLDPDAAPDGGAHLFRGTVEGRITDAPHGDGGFGYDPLFFVDDLGCTFGEASAADKDARSHRGHAFRQLAGHLASTGRGTTA